jgi:CheY-like chemotaxis protein
MIVARSGQAEAGSRGVLQKSQPAEATEAEISQARRMQVVGQLTGGIVHDFNNILTVISGTIEILAEAVADRAELAAIAALIDQAAARGADLTAHLLAFARGQPSRPRKVDVNALLVDAARLLRPTLGEQIEIDSKLSADVATALVDPYQLMTAILNLAIDARDAMPEGGRLIFKTAVAVVENGGAGADSGAIAGNYVMVAVSACRYGIAADHPERAFADLGAVQQCVGPLNGHIQICSEAEHGTAVKLYLPEASRVAEPPAENSNHSPVEGGDEAILIVEDDALLRSYVVTQVQDLGYRTFAASSAVDALKIIDEGEAIDLLFTDVIMPGPINGRQLAAEALNRRPSLRVLYTSGYAEDAMAAHGRPDADVPLLAKPYRKGDLAKMIRTALTV